MGNIRVFKKAYKRYSAYLNIDEVDDSEATEYSMLFGCPVAYFNKGFPLKIRNF